jgi:hypothetical protein
MSVEGMSGRRDRPARRSEAGLSPVIFRRIRQHNRTRRGRRPPRAGDTDDRVGQAIHRREGAQGGVSHNADQPTW